MASIATRQGAAIEAASVLGVDRSLSGKRWIERCEDSRLGAAIAQAHGLPEVLGRVLAGRGVGIDAVDGFMDPKLRDSLPDPSRFKDMDRAVERVIAAVRGSETIAVFGDYDVDGATSAALLTRFFAAVGAKTTVYVPDRRREGYGPNAPALLELKRRGASVVVTVDCGTSAHEALGAARDAGLDVIVVDHHVAEAALPPAIAIVNPNRLDEAGLGRELAAVGVSFLLAIAVNRALRDSGWYKTRPEPDLREWLDLVALGTVADVVPLTGLNRAFVAQGLQVLARRRNPGLVALAETANIAEAPTAYHLGFILGPRVNAGGRVGESDLGVRLLSSDDPAEAMQLARRLHALNDERRAIEADVLAAAETAVAADPPDRIAFAVGAGWHPGVIGIVASRLVERFGRPAIVIGLDGDTGIGSGRSISGFDLGSAVIAARQAGLLVKGGGHAMAAGLTVTRDRVEALRQFLGERAGQIASSALVPRLALDGSVRISGATVELAQSLARLSPFGMGNPEPRFAIAAARVAFADVVGTDHVRCQLTDETGARIKGIAFRAVGSDLGRALLGRDGQPLHIAGRLKRDSWQGRDRVELTIDDAALAYGSGA
ncbi:MAG: single-stranded-DNA-specific exonuclease RecJ [Rhodospirillales bacterium]|nr:single-stranded-DNA-specific exonuclease RecJ [Rhodospirillales bacterium]